MADPIPNAAPTTQIPQAPGGTTEVTIPGTNMGVPTGAGVEKVVAVPAPFGVQSPPWYTPQGTVWSQMGCAVPQPGPQLQTANSMIWDLINFCGLGLFEVMWKWSPDRLCTDWPSKLALWDMHQLLVTARARLDAITNPPGANPLTPGKTGAVLQMWLAYPVPYYGPLGAVNDYFNKFARATMRACSDAMQHSNNSFDYYVDKTFNQMVKSYITWLMVQMATKYFGAKQADAMAPDYVVPDAAWAAYDPSTQAVSFESTSALPPLNYVSPTESDLQNIKGLTYENVIPFLQAWPDSQYKVASGGIFANSSSPATDIINKASGPASSSGADSLNTTGGPPTA